jgi:hypothetical protein
MTKADDAAWGTHHKVAVPYVQVALDALREKGLSKNSGPCRWMADCESTVPELTPTDPFPRGRIVVENDLRTGCRLSVRSLLRHNLCYYSLLYLSFFTCSLLALRLCDRLLLFLLLIIVGSGLSGDSSGSSAGSGYRTNSSCYESGG